MAEAQLRSTRPRLLRLTEMSGAEPDQAVATERHGRLLGSPLGTDEAMHVGPPRLDVGVSSPATLRARTSSVEPAQWNASTSCDQHLSAEKGTNQHAPVGPSVDARRAIRRSCYAKSSHCQGAAMRMSPFPVPANRIGLEAIACEYYHVTRDEHDRVLGSHNGRSTVVRPPVPPRRST